MKSIQDLLVYTETLLAEFNIDSPEAESKWLVGHILKLSLTDLVTKTYHIKVDKEIIDDLERLISRRLKGEPLQYITGSTEFYNSNILVGPGVFIPRPETELMVDQALRHLNHGGDILDLCTGSGAVIFALSKELSGSCNFIGVDSSFEALRWAKLNLDHIGDSRIQFLAGDLFSPVPEQQFEIITANPPYISPTEFEKLPTNIKNYEPHEALLSDQQGLSVLTRIAKSAQNHLVEGGWLFCEIGETQGNAIANTFVRNNWRNVKIFKDYNSCDRIVSGQK